MDSDKVKKICADYADDIRDKSQAIYDGVAVEVERLHDAYAHVKRTDIPMMPTLGHLLFMCEEIPRLLDAGRTEKAMRWLGWLQGALWWSNFETLHDAKMRNAPEGATYDREA